tara:strand:- start:373 stop:702 length:330 start_codon:yes stop_codon:yes gene_type:complete
MNLNKTLEKLLATKEELISSIEVCCKSIEFWEKRAEKVFDSMDRFEEEVLISSEEPSKDKYKSLMKESGKIMNRINFENGELDKLEAEILELEEKIIKTLARYAKKQKK